LILNHYYFPRVSFRQQRNDKDILILDDIRTIDFVKMASLSQALFSSSAKTRRHDEKISIGHGLSVCRGVAQADDKGVLARMPRRRRRTNSMTAIAASRRGGS
jgi:hypothetical protein